MELLGELTEKIFNIDVLITAMRVLIIVASGFVILKILSFAVSKATAKRFSAQSTMLIRKAIFYAGAFIVLLAVLKQLGVKLTALLGAAGIVGIAVGFASQTSVSNIISGLFLISEKPFAVNDIIQVDNIVGVIMSIDLLSVKVRTFDNQFIRVPNEKLIKTEVTNVTKFPIRRLNINLSVAYKEDIGKVRALLLDIARENPYCLDNPEPLFAFKEFGDHGIELVLGVWFVKTDYWPFKNSIMQEIKERFESEGIEIPFPHISLYTGSATHPFPIRIEKDDDDGKGENG